MHKTMGAHTWVEFYRLVCGRLHRGQRLKQMTNGLPKGQLHYDESKIMVICFSDGANDDKVWAQL